MINRKIESLIPAMQPVVRTFFEKLKTAGIKFAIVETLRTQEIQNCYYMQGRENLDIVNSARKTAGLWPINEKENSRTVTNTKNSRHMTGRAIDICPLDDKGNFNWSAPQESWERIGKIGEEVGLDWAAGGFGDTWGRRWDNPHFEFQDL